MLNYVCINYMQIIKQRAGAFKCHDVQPNQVKYNDNCLKHGRKIWTKEKIEKEPGMGKIEEN